MGIISLFSKLGPGLHDTLYFTAVTYPVTKEWKSLQLGNTDFYGCESEEKIFFSEIIRRLLFFNSQINYTRSPLSNGNPCLNILLATGTKH